MSETTAKERLEQMPLLPCPFCGLDGLWRVKEGGKDEGYILCAVCKARGPAGSPHELAELYWNRRRQPKSGDSVDAVPPGLGRLRTAGTPSLPG